MRLACLLLFVLAVPSVAHAQLSVSGRPVPALSGFDDAMQSYMADHDISAGTLGVMHDGQIVYLRSFGRTYNGTSALPENALWRLASCSKPVTAAAARRLIASGSFALGDHAFDLGQTGGGLLDLAPFPSVGDTRLEDVTVDHLLHHEGGWDRGVVADVTYREREIAADMFVGSPPGRTRTVRWILGQPLQFVPGSRQEYSNVGPLVMGLIVEQASGQDLIDVVRQRVLTPSLWVPATEILAGRTFRADQNPREPFYESGTSVTSVFDGRGTVPRAYGGWDHEARIGQGGYVASAAAMLTFLEHYHVGVFDDDIGQSIGSTFPLSGSEWHNGAFGDGGLNSYMAQRTDGVNVFIVFNLDGSPHLAGDFYTNHLDALIDAVPTWPTDTSDGFWVRTAGVGPVGFGGYDRPFGSVESAVDATVEGSKLRLLPGTSTWAGVLAERLLLDAPLGAASLGN